MVDDRPTPDRLLQHLLLTKREVTTKEFAAILGVSRQAAHGHLRRFVEVGWVVAEGAARATRYRVPPPVVRTYRVAGLAEDEVYRDLRDHASALSAVSSEAESIFAYAVTELVNNVIDHSRSDAVDITIARAGPSTQIDIVDHGVGVFRHVAQQLALESPLAALQEITKGKTTTAPDRHSGEGLFFVSKAVDFFRLESGDLAWLVDNERADEAIERLEVARVGTLARFEVDATRPRSLPALFAAYTSDHAFDKTRTVIKLFAFGVRFVSRSEAKRLLHGLADKFREVTLDFAGVHAIGQGFADEVFRVWARSHPEVALAPVNMNDAVAFMVERAEAERR